MVDVGGRPWRHPWHRPTPRSLRARARVAVTAAAVGAGVAAAVPPVDASFPPVPAATPVAVVVTTGLIALVVVEARAALPRQRPGGLAWTCLVAAAGLTVGAVAGGPAWTLPVAAPLATPTGLATAEDADEERLQLRGTAWLCWAAVATAAAVRLGLGPAAPVVAFTLGLAAFGALQGAVALAVTDRAWTVYDGDALGAAVGLSVIGGGVTVALAGPPTAGASIAVIGAAIVLGRVVAVGETLGRSRVGMRGPVALAGLGVAGLGSTVLVEGSLPAGIAITAVGGLVLVGVVVDAISHDAARALIVVGLVAGVVGLGVALAVAGIVGLGEPEPDVLASVLATGFGATVALLGLQAVVLDRVVGTAVWLVILGVGGGATFLAAALAADGAAVVGRVLLGGFGVVLTLGGIAAPWLFPRDPDA